MTGDNSHSPDALARAFSPDDSRLKAHERAGAALAHLVSLPPLWGVVFAAGIIYYYRESSRAVAFQARQAIFLHLLFLGIGTAGILVRLFATLLETAFPGLGLEAVAPWFDYPKALLLYIVFCVFPVGAAAFSAMGYNVVYPWIGPRLREEPRPDETDELYG